MILHNTINTIVINIYCYVKLAYVRIDCFYALFCQVLHDNDIA
jgi:hypothetical protein